MILEKFAQQLLNAYSSLLNRKQGMNQTNNNSGAGFISLLQLVFITLKLTGYIKWSWFWVLSPTWISLGLAIALLILCLWLIRK